MTTVLSAKVIAAFADAMRMRPTDAVTFVRNTTEDTRRAIADKYTQQYEPTSDAERNRILDSVAIRMAMAANLSRSAAEQRARAGSGTEFRVMATGLGTSGDTIHGLVTPFNTVTDIGGQPPAGFREQIKPGAFTRTLKERPDVVMLDNHDPGRPVARTSAGTMQLKQTSRGLEVTATPVADTTYTRDLLANIKAGNIKGMSFGMHVRKDSWTDDDGKPSDMWTGTNRTIHDAELHEVSPCTLPAYPTTEVGVRGINRKAS